MAQAPQGIIDLSNAIIAAYGGPGMQDEQLAGIVHGPSDSPGFHWSFSELAQAGALGNYSLAATRNHNGAAAHPDLAAALDMHFGPVGMVNVTRRLIAAARAKHPAMAPVYEFCGTTNGSTPHPYTVATQTDDPNNTQGWDSSHVTHVHISFWRDSLDRIDAIGLARVIAGIALPAPPREDDDVKIVRNKDHQAVPVVLGLGAKPQAVGDDAKLHGLTAAGVPTVLVPDADYKALRAWADAP